MLVLILKEDIKNHLINKNVSIFDVGPYNDTNLLTILIMQKNLETESNRKKAM